MDNWPDVRALANQYTGRQSHNTTKLNTKQNNNTKQNETQGTTQNNTRYKRQWTKDKRHKYMIHITITYRSKQSHLKVQCSGPLSNKQQ